MKVDCLVINPSALSQIYQALSSELAAIEPKQLEIVKGHRAAAGTGEQRIVQVRHGLAPLALAHTARTAEFYVGLASRLLRRETARPILLCFELEVRLDFAR